MRNRSVLRFVVLVLGLGAAACSSGGGGGSSNGFQLERINLTEGAVWKINQEMVLTFSEPVDFSTVSFNTINIQTTGGTPATGIFFARGTTQVVFQPNCPKLANLSDSGLKAGGIAYVLRVVGQSSGSANTVRAASGEALQVTQVRNFTTAPIGAEFLDTQPGPPAPVVRPQGSSLENATYLEIGGDPDNRVYFERDPSQNLVLSEPGFEVPLNLYSDAGSRIALVIQLNQAVHPQATNVSDSRFLLEFQDPGGLWQPMKTTVTLLSNCVDGGSKVRVEPIGIFPQGRPIRAEILAGLVDLNNQSTPAALQDFAQAQTANVNFASLAPADEFSDAFAEDFNFGGTSALSFEDGSALFESPRAKWGNGRLEAAFDFDGTGGPGGDFDWLVQDGESVLVDTVNGTITASDGRVQLVQDGQIDVRDMTLEAGSVVRVQGNLPLRINASGDVIIRGLLDLSGFDAQDVLLPDTGDVKESGGRGGPGGGRGGDANEVTTTSTPRGGVGQGPSGLLNAGSNGGESALAPASAGKEGRRPGGGGGGRFARDQGALVAQNGTRGVNSAKSAVDTSHGPRGGTTSAGPFVDGDNTNDFFGTQAVAGGGSVTLLLKGELPSLWGGYGGGGGGNAIPSDTFPAPNWNKTTDEKGGAGGGGGGGLHVRALGVIQFGAAGQIRANGGRGGIGENILIQDHVGGNGGSGSGGHVILETASFIDFTDGGVSVGAAARDWVSALGGPQILGATTATPNVSFGGAGGPGVIQLHVPQSTQAPTTSSATSDIVVPTAAVGAGALDAIASPAAIPLIPAFGAISKARSKWISVGGAELDSAGNTSLISFLFQGIETTPGADEGKVLVTGDQVQEIAALLDEDLEGNANVAVLPDRVTLRIAGASLAPFAGTTGTISNDIYLRNPALLAGFILRLSVAAVSHDFQVSGGSYDDGNVRLDVTVVDDGTDLQDFITANTSLGNIHYELVPRFFRVRTAGVENALPSSSFVRILFQAAADDGSGNPDAANPLVDWTADISAFNALAPGDLQFFRFEVEFDLGSSGVVTSDTQVTDLDFLHIPFVF